MKNWLKNLYADAGISLFMLFVALGGASIFGVVIFFIVGAEAAGKIPTRWAAALMFTIAFLIIIGVVTYVRRMELPKQ